MLILHNIVFYIRTNYYLVVILYVHLDKYHILRYVLNVCFFLFSKFLISLQVCIKSASPIIPAPRSVIERRIRLQQIETNKRSSRSLSVVTNKIKVNICFNFKLIEFSVITYINFRKQQQKKKKFLKVDHHHGQLKVLQKNMDLQLKKNCQVKMM